MSAFAEQWGRPLERDGYTQITNRLLRGKYWRQLLLEREARIILRIISYQDDPEYGTIPSAKQIAYDAGVSYNTVRNLLKRLTNPIKDDAGKTIRRTLLIPVLLKQGRIRYNMTPLRYALEKLEKDSAVQMVKSEPKVRPAPKPAPIVTLYEESGTLAEMTSKAVVDEDAVADWEEIKEYIKEEISEAAYNTWIAPTRGRYRDDSNILWVDVPSSSHESMLLGRFRDIIDRCRKLYGIASIACRVLLVAATVGV